MTGFEWLVMANTAALVVLAIGTSILFLAYAKMVPAVRFGLDTVHNPKDALLENNWPHLLQAVIASSLIDDRVKPVGDLPKPWLVLISDETCPNCQELASVLSNSDRFPVECESLILCNWFSTLQLAPLPNVERIWTISLEVGKPDAGGVVVPGVPAAVRVSEDGLMSGGLGLPEVIKMLGIPVPLSKDR